MQGNYELILEIWTYANVKREPEKWQPNENCDIKNPVIKYSANNFNDAYSKAQCIIIGVKLDGRVHQCLIRSLRYAQYD